MSVSVAYTLRLELGFEPVEAARVAGFSLSQWGALEQRTTNPTLLTVLKLRRLARRAGWTDEKLLKELAAEVPGGADLAEG